MRAEARMKIPMRSWKTAGFCAAEVVLAEMLGRCAGRVPGPSTSASTLAVLGLIPSFVANRRQASAIQYERVSDVRSW